MPPVRHHHNHTLFSPINTPCSAPLGTHTWHSMALLALRGTITPRGQAQNYYRALDTSFRRHDSRRRRGGGRSVRCQHKFLYLFSYWRCFNCSFGINWVVLNLVHLFMSRRMGRIMLLFFSSTFSSCLFIY